MYGSTTVPLWVRNLSRASPALHSQRINFILVGLVRGRLAGMYCVIAQITNLCQSTPLREVEYIV